jgi:dynein heavy chain
MATKKEVQTPECYLRLWAHECTRIFGDRLINNEDRKWMLNMIRECTRAPFGSNFDTVFAHLDTDKNGKVETLDEFRGLLFGDLYAPYGQFDRPYEELMDKLKVTQSADAALESYNAQSDKPMPLVLFNFAIEHLLRIGRILK